VAYDAWFQGLVAGCFERGLKPVVKLTGSKVSAWLTFMAKYPTVDYWMLGNEPRLEPPHLSEDEEAKSVIEQCTKIRDRFPNEVLIGPPWAGLESMSLRSRTLDLGLLDIVDYEGFNFYVSRASDSAYSSLLESDRIWPSEFNTLPNTPHSVFVWWIERLRQTPWPVVPFFLLNEQDRDNASEWVLYRGQDADPVKPDQINHLKSVFSTTPQPEPEPEPPLPTDRAPEWFVDYVAKVTDPKLAPARADWLKKWRV